MNKYKVTYTANGYDDDTSLVMADYFSTENSHVSFFRRVYGKVGGPMGLELVAYFCGVVSVEKVSE